MPNQHTKGPRRDHLIAVRLTRLELLLLKAEAKADKRSFADHVRAKLMVDLTVFAKRSI